jgi:hypothetical protein
VLVCLDNFKIKEISPLSKTMALIAATPCIARKASLMVELLILEI